MFQRLEKLRKNAFASVIVAGVDNANTISGIWIMRGQELAFTVSTEQFSLYPYQRLSIPSWCCWEPLRPADETLKSIMELLELENGTLLSLSLS